MSPTLRGVYLDAVVEQMRCFAKHRPSFLQGSDDPFGREQTLSTIYFGGGTPSVYSPAELQKVVEAADCLWGIESDAEITVEANPDDITDQWVDELSSTRFNRISLGIQSFVDRDLKFMNRRHDAHSAQAAVERLKRGGMDNISIDLIYGLPQMSDQEWAENIDKAVALDVSHISAYALSIEQGTLFAKHGVESVDDETFAQQYELLSNRLPSADFDHYEISNFAKANRHSRHNSAYWDSSPYLGLGAAAHSYDGGRVRWSVVSDVAKYVKGVCDEQIYQHECLDDEQLFEEMLMLGLRRSCGVDLGDVERRFGARRLQELTHKAAMFSHCGLHLTDQKLYFDSMGWMLSDWVLARLL